MIYNLLAALLLPDTFIAFIQTLTNPEFYSLRWLVWED
jgi:hypothetical protein